MISWAITSFILASVGLILIFWPKIVFFFSKKIIPWIRKYMGDKVADIVAEIIAFIDKGVVAVRKAAKSVISTIKEYWKFLHKYILKKEREYIDNDDGTYTIKDSICLPCDSNSVQVITQQSKMEWEDLPTEIRHEQIRRNAKKMKQDDKKIMESKFFEQAEEKGVSKKVLLELEC